MLIAGVFYFPIKVSTIFNRMLCYALIIIFILILVILLLARLQLGLEFKNIKSYNFYFLCCIRKK